MRKNSLLLSVVLMIFSQAVSQNYGPACNICDSAKVIRPGEQLFNIDNQFANVTALETPEGEPVTCIRSFENDLWFSFHTEAGYQFYEINILPLTCNTPAGLQALLIRTDDCDATSFEYVDCHNPYAEAPIRMFLQDSVPGRHYLIYVDGYDGTQCTFNLSLSGHQRNPQTINDIKGRKLDYGNSPTPYEPADVEASFINNEVEIIWTARSDEDVTLFLVQRFYQHKPPFKPFGSTIGTVEPVSTVGSSQTTTYSFYHQQEFREGEEYCYRIVKVDKNLRKSYSDGFCMIADMAEDFFISPVYPGTEAGTFVVKTRNFRKQDLVFSVLNAEGELEKQMTLKKEPKRDGSITIDMQGFAPGKYSLKVEGKEEYFLRRFVVE